MRAEQDRREYNGYRTTASRERGIEKLQHELREQKRRTRRCKRPEPGPRANATRGDAIILSPWIDASDDLPHSLSVIRSASSTMPTVEGQTSGYHDGVGLGQVRGNRLV